MQGWVDLQLVGYITDTVMTTHYNQPGYYWDGWPSGGPSTNRARLRDRWVISVVVRCRCGSRTGAPSGVRRRRHGASRASWLSTGCTAPWCVTRCRCLTASSTRLTTASKSHSRPGCSVSISTNCLSVCEAEWKCDTRWKCGTILRGSKGGKLWYAKPEEQMMVVLVCILY